MPIRLFAIILIASFIVAACNPSSKKEEETGEILVPGSYIERQFGRCDTVTNSGVSIKISLWQPADSSEADQNIRDILTAKSIQRINSYGDSASIAANPAAGKSVAGAFEVFQKNYTDFKKQMPDAPGCWEVELKGDTVMATPKMLFYQLDHYAFTGGAHPNSFKSYHAFDLKTGEEVDMKTFVADSAALLKLIEKHFRSLEKLNPDADLEKAGYFLVNHKFAAPVNYVFTKTGVLFYYNPYEIAAYARGAIQFTIPYAELGELVKMKEVF